MCFYIRIEDLVANAMIEVLKNGNRRFLTYDEIEKYGMEVIEILNKKNEKAVLKLSRQYTDDFLRDYSDFFGEKMDNNLLGISLKEGKDLEDLISYFRGYISLDVLLAFSDDKAVQTLLA